MEQFIASSNETVNLAVLDGINVCLRPRFGDQRGVAGKWCNPTPWMNFILPPWAGPSSRIWTKTINDP